MALVARIYPLPRRGLSDEAIGYPERLCIVRSRRPNMTPNEPMTDKMDHAPPDLVIW
jgi:hypothetical protein